MHKPESEQEEWMEEAPLLASMQGTQPVEAPEGYFNGLSARIMDRVKAETALEADGEPVRRIQPLEIASGNKRSIRPYLSWAAGLALLLAIGAFWMSHWQAPTTASEATFAQQLEQLSDEAILEHLNFSDLDEAELTDLMDGEAMASLGPDWQDMGQETVEFLEDMNWEDLDLNELDLGNLEDLNINFEQEI